MTEKQRKKWHLNQNWLNDFEPDNDKNRKTGIFGLPCSYADSRLIIIPVPWDISSDNHTLSSSPELVIDFSRQISLYTEEQEGFWKKGIFSHNVPQKWKETSEELFKIRKKIARLQGSNGSKHAEILQHIKNINFTCRLLNEWIESKSDNCLSEHKLVGFLGGDMSYTPGIINAISKSNQHFGILHLDSFSGFEKNSNGFDFTSSSALIPVLKNPFVKKIVLFGTSRINYHAAELIRENQQKISLYSLQYLDESKMKGLHWKMLINEALNELPEHIFLNISLTCLDSSEKLISKNSVPGGLSHAELKSILTELRNNSKKVIGFSLGNIQSVSANDILNAAYLLFDMCRTLITCDEKAETFKIQKLTG